MAIKEQDLRCELDRCRRTLWQVIDHRWFEDLDEKQKLGLCTRSFVAGTGVLSFIALYLLINSDTALGFEASVNLMVLGIAVFTVVGLGFLLAWKREHTGPVRLFVSGVFLPYLVFLAVSIATLLGNLRLKILEG